MVTKYVATDPSVGNDNNSGDDAGHPWLSFQKSIDRLVALRTNPQETCTLMIMNYQVNEPAALKGPSYSKFEFIGVTIANVNNDPHQEVLFCEPRVRLTSWDATKSIFTIEAADDILFKNLQLFDSNGGGGVSADNAKRVHLLTCCIHGNKAKRGGGILFDNCTDATVEKCRVWENEATVRDGGGGDFVMCKGATIKGSVFYSNKAKDSGGALSFYKCTGDIVVEGNTFGEPQKRGNKAKIGGAVAADSCENVFFGSASGKNTFTWNEASENGGALSLKLCKYAQIVRDVFADNSVTGAITGGGAIYSGGSDLTIHEADIDHNHSAMAGGGIKVRGENDSNHNLVDGKLTLQECLIHRNDATSEGGGLRAKNVAVTITNCSFYERNTGSAGGGLSFSDSMSGGGKHKLEIQGGKFQENAAGGSGGGCDIFEGEFSIDSTEFTENKAKWGGGLCFFGTLPNVFVDLESCRFADNEAQTGGAAHFYGAVHGRIQTNRIIDNQAGVGAGLHFDYDVVRSLKVTGNTFSGNKGTGDIVVEQDRSTPPMTVAELEKDNTVGKAVPVVIVK
jgi:hypothetical protein